MRKLAIYSPVIMLPILLAACGTSEKSAENGAEDSQVMTPADTPPEAGVAEAKPESRATPGENAEAPKNTAEASPRQLPTSAPVAQPREAVKAAAKPKSATAAIPPKQSAPAPVAPPKATQPATPPPAEDPHAGHNMDDM